MTILQYVAEDDPNRASPNWWWVVSAGVSAISEQVNISFIKLQHKNLLISEQTQELDNLAAIICTQIVVEGLFMKEELDVIDKTMHITYNNYLFN